MSKKEMDIIEKAGIKQDIIEERIAAITKDIIAKEEQKELNELAVLEVGALIELFFNARDKRVKQAAQILDAEKKRQTQIEKVIIGKLEDSGQDGSKVAEVG